MARTTFLEHYRVRIGYDGAPTELGRDGGAVAYEAIDERSSEPVVVTLVPVEGIDSAVREQFEEQARAVQRLRHVNIAKVFDFGREGEDYVYVSERLPGETLAAWVAQHGPMPADATLRVAEQIVSVLSGTNCRRWLAISEGDELRLDRAQGGHGRLPTGRDFVSPSGRRTQAKRSTSEWANIFCAAVRNRWTSRRA
jgi:hypothetical protein